ncbi:unnamed protein product [Adineta ricciae]|uniref:TIR domain-containing protein n=1 Tax=Adineta ricciae TaxID=249248 RepID=A0A813Q096_ADIRI|nr:unnamed protein product [Adineta ricciae]CAF1227837.1 unnamed protein product [Adineta ricciae]
MTNNIEDLVANLSSTTLADTVSSEIATILQNVDTKSLLKFVSENFNALLVLEQSIWQILSEDSRHCFDQSKCFEELFHTLLSFNKNLIFTSDETNSDMKVSLLTPQSQDIITGILKQLENCNDDNDPYYVMISLWLDNFSYYMHEEAQYVMSSVVNDLEYSIADKFIMVDQYKAYLNQLQQTNFSHKQLFYLQTCSFSISSYLFCKGQKLPFTSEEILHYLAKDYLQLIQQSSFNVQSWSKDFLSCITQINNLINACCWWSSDKEKSIKILLPSKDISHMHIQSLIRILQYKPFHQEIQVQRSNTETILIGTIMNLLIVISDIHSLVCFIRTETKLIEILLPLAETSKYNRISLFAYVILGEVLSDEHLKELKITTNICDYFFYMLEHAWNHPAHHFQRTSVPQLLRGFLNLAKNDIIQQKTADTNRIPLLINMCDQYSIVYDILWALSFNHDIQHQLRSNRKLMMKLTHLKQELNNAAMRKITHGILWNLESIHEDRAPSENEDGTTFDIMISYSHKDKLLCKQIYDELINTGYRVWIDFDQLRGNVMDAMTQAIERSNMIVICMSEEYRRSNYCRAEAHYAFQRQLKMVPILLEKHYRPDGWLLFLVGQLLYVDFTKYEFARAMEMLFKELEAPIQQDHKVTLTLTETTDPAVVINNDETTLLESSSLPDDISEWRQTDVQNWLIGLNLMQTSRLLCDYNGSNLMNLNRYLSTSEPQVILKFLQDDAIEKTNQNLSLIEFARFQDLLGQQISYSKKFNRRQKPSRFLCCTIL